MDYLLAHDREITYNLNVSSKLATEDLTTAIIKGILSALAKPSKLTGSELYQKVRAKMPRLIKNQLAVKGGYQEFRRVLYYLSQRGYITRTYDEDETLFTLTTKGWSRLQALSFRPLARDTNEAWDGKWRVVTFDIPEEKREARDALRWLIKQLGFKPLHKSVWIHPLPCQKEIRLIQEAYGAKEHITLLEVDNFDQAAKFRRLFAADIK
ncbi:hypothetical protein HY441_02385 [Candidatus Microgenomates bacterium]|nr:hypothetical protein [Candidatus Microgenomates bacterium]